jgi:hypothetical protein
MPILDFPDPPPPAVVAPEVNPGPVYICTISPDDKGEACVRCGLSHGTGHGVVLEKGKRP